MKKCLLNIFLAICLMLSCVPVAIAVPGEQDNPKTVAADAGYLENVLLEKLPGKERIALVVSEQPAVSVGNQTDGTLLVKLENMFVPQNLRHNFGEDKLNNIVRVTTHQKTLEGKQWAYLTIDIKEAVPYAVRQEGKVIFIDFNVSNLLEKKRHVSTASQSGRVRPVRPINPVNKEASTRQADKLVSLDFQDADIKSVLRLMAEYGNMSIVSGDDVKGNVTLTMKNVPWEQALDTILDVNGLAKKKMGNVISVMTLDKKKKDEGDKVKAEEDQRKAEDQRKDRELKLMVEKGLLKQILIEAKIVEATENFTRNLGVQWGLGTNQSVSGGRYGLGISAGSSNSISRQYSQTYPSQIPWSTTDGTQLGMGAVNFPSLATTAVSPALGVVFGGANAFLEVQLAALEETSTGKIISAPKIVTMEGVKATIKQGSEIPYVTPASGTSPATISFKEALLKLEVTPKITDEGKISMEIKANNDQPDYVNMIVGTTNPPIKKSEIDSKIVVQNGDTVVIGGIVKTNDNKTVSGLPWLQKIPVLGWLFKTENIDKEKTQLLIFITPKILQGTDFVGTLGRNNN